MLLFLKKHGFFKAIAREQMEADGLDLGRCFVVRCGEFVVLTVNVAD
jgi:hypothetical protein